MNNSFEKTMSNKSDRIVLGEDGVPVYTSFSDIPDNLKSNTYFEENGLEHDGIVLGRMKRGYFNYLLYDINTATKSDKPPKKKRIYKNKNKNKPKEVKADYSKWDNVPENLFTLSQLKNKGLRHNNEIDATAIINKKIYYLFDINKAIPVDEIPKGAKFYTKSKMPKNLKGVNYFANNGILHTGIVKGLYKSSSGYHELYDINDFVIENKIRYRNFYEDNINLKDKKSISWEKIIDDMDTNPDKYIMLDTETTGKDPYDEIIQLAITDLYGNVLFNSYFNPKAKMSKGATAKHGLEKKDLKDAPTWSNKWLEISSILRDKTIIAYNAIFDINMIKSTCSNHNIKIDFKMKYICALEYARHKYKGLLSSYSLESVISYLNMDFNTGNTHEALFDTYACLYVIKPDAMIFKKRELAKKYYNAMVRFDNNNVGIEQRKIEGNRWLQKNFNCNESCLNNISINMCNKIIDELEKFVLKNNLI